MRSLTPSQLSQPSADALASSSPSASGRLASSTTLALTVATHLTALYLVGSTWSATQTAWIERDRWGPHVGNLATLAALVSPTAFVLAMRLAARLLERRNK